jgi:large subunit ribosomal protein L20
MTRVKRGNVARKRRKKVLNLAEGFRGSSSKLFRTAQQQTMKALRYSYRDRQQRKRAFSSLWVSRVNGVIRNYGLSYSVFKYELQNSQIVLNRKILSQVAVRDQKAFQQLITLVNK